jgi:hypothetical protein
MTIDIDKVNDYILFYGIVLEHDICELKKLLQNNLPENLRGTNLAGRKTN